jgi:hypothetical protein
LAKRKTASSPHDLIHFQNPPVGEVALTFQFARDAVDLDVLARFANEVRKAFPIQEQQPLAPPMRESFDVVPPPEPPFEIKFEPSLALPRTWFISQDRSRLIQIQADRISLNWRQTDSARYPRYETLRRDLGRHFNTLRRCVEAGDRTMPPINMCEVNYVNPVSVATPVKGGGHPELALVINRLSRRSRTAYLPHVEDAQFAARWRIPGSEIGSDAGRPVGRLYLSAAPGFKPPQLEPIYIVNLLGRVIPVSDRARAVWKALDVAHEWAVLGFKDVTTEQMHKAWGIQERVMK